MKPNLTHKTILVSLFALMPIVGEASTYLFRVPVTGTLPGLKCVPGSMTYSTPFTDMRLPVSSSNCKQITVTLKGAAGGNGPSSSGGAGGLVSFTLPANKFTGTWTGTVGEAGNSATCAYGGGQGGGYSSVSLNGTIIAVAGGGGGAGTGPGIGTVGGDGGNPGGYGGDSGDCATGAAGGSSTSPGRGGFICSGFNSGGSSYAGSAFKGGNAEDTGAKNSAGPGNGGLGSCGSLGNGGAGGGGGGFFGGGGGTSGGNGETGGGGGGGSNYVVSSATNVQNITGGGGQPGSNPGGYISISWN